VEILEGECSLFSNYLVQSSFLFGVGTAFLHLFISTPPLNLTMTKDLFGIDFDMLFSELHKIMVNKMQGAR